MVKNKNRQEARLQELMVRAKEMNLQVRKEKLLREAGYRVHSGHCRINGQDVIYIDRDVPIEDQIEFLASELAELQPPPSGAGEDAALSANAEESLGDQPR